MRKFAQILKLICLSLLLVTCSKDSSNENEVYKNETSTVKQFELTVNVIPEGSGTASVQSGTYSEGQQVTITASPSGERFEFEKWSGANTSEEASITITMDSNKTLTANFAEIPPVYSNGAGVIGNLGGTIMVEDETSPLMGTILEIPEGAMDEEVEISFKQASINSPEEFEDVFMIELEPSGLEFQKPVKVTIPYQKDIEQPSFYFYSPDSLIIEKTPPIAFDIQNKTVTAEITHFSTYFSEEEDFVSANVQLLSSGDTVYALIQIDGSNRGLTGIPTIRLVNNSNISNILNEDILNYWDWLEPYQDLYATFDVELKKRGFINSTVARTQIAAKRGGRSFENFNASIIRLEPDFAIRGLIEDVEQSTLEGFFDGSALVIPFDYTINSTEDYFLKISWVVSNNPFGKQGWTTLASNQRLTTNYHINTRTLNVQNTDDLDENNNFINDGYENNDSDGDGIPDEQDLCPSDFDETPDVQEDFDGDGFGDACDEDIDNDGVANNDDFCDTTPLGSEVNEFGCAADEFDTDGDNVFDNVDECPNTPSGSGEVDEKGCALSERDTDGDGVNDAVDQCPDTPEGTDVDENGCGTLTIIRPNSTTAWEIGDQNNLIEWNPADLGGEVSLELYKDGVKRSTIASNTANDGEYVLDLSTASLPSGNDYQIRLASIEFASKWELSSNFTINQPENLVPEKPYDPYPSDDEEIEETSITLFWNASDPEDDDLVFDVHFGTDQNPPRVSNDQEDDIYQLSDLELGQTYYWYIVAKDVVGNTTESEVWSFSVKGNDSGNLIVQTNEPEILNPSETILKGEITSSNGETIIDHGFFVNYSGNNPPDENGYDEEFSLGEGGVGSFQVQYLVPELGVTSTYVAYAKTSNTTVIGEAISFRYESAPPIVTIFEPTDNATFTMGDQITINGSVTQDDANTDYFSSIYIKVNGNIIYEIPESEAGNFSRIWDTSSLSPGYYTIAIEAVDGFGNIVLKERNINLVNQNGATKFSPRTDHSSVIFDDKIWVIGGLGTGSGFKNDVWYSSDGLNWTEATVSANFSPRKKHTSVVYDNNIWVVAGYDGSPKPNDYKNDVWYSSDGVSWFQATSSANFSSRQMHTSTVFDNRKWVIGGWNFIERNDVWHSENGTNWIQASPTSNFSPRSAHTTVVFDSKIWVIGGANKISSDYYNDVWYSSDGINWVQANFSADFSPRVLHSSVVFDNKIWIIGGGEPGRNLKNDVWYSNDGLNWIQATASANFSPRYGHTSVVFDNKIWVIGGVENEYKNDVWYSSDGINWIEAK